MSNLRIIPAGLLMAIMESLFISCKGPAVPYDSVNSFSDLSGPFLGQALPDSIPELFAPGVVSTGMFTRDVAISPDGDEAVGGEFFPSLTNDGTLYFTRNEKGSALNQVFRSRSIWEPW